MRQVEYNFKSKFHFTKTNKVRRKQIELLPLPLTAKLGFLGNEERDFDGDRRDGVREMGG